MTTQSDIAQSVRAHCTIPSNLVTEGSDEIVNAVADWIENPPEWMVDGWVGDDSRERLSEVRALHPGVLVSLWGREALVCGTCSSPYANVVYPCATVQACGSSEP